MSNRVGEGGREGGRESFNDTLFCRLEHHCLMRKGLQLLGN